MDNFLYSMVEAFDRMRIEVSTILKETKYSEKERNRIFFAVGTCLHCIIDYAERNVIEGQEHTKLLSAFRYANNSLKHGHEVIEITKEEGGICFPIQFPLCMPERKIIWKIIDNGKMENQKNNYKKYLEGKDVIETCEK